MVEAVIRLLQHIRDCPLFTLDGVIRSSRNTRREDVHVWFERLKELADDESKQISSLVEDMKDTETWIELKRALGNWITKFEVGDVQTQLLGFMAKHWPTHAPRELEFAELRLKAKRLSDKYDRVVDLLKIPTESKRAKHSHAVIICREHETSVAMFDDLGTAAVYHDNAGAQWSESYLCQVLKGPLI